MMLCEAGTLSHIFYHATSTICLDEIKQKGLLADPANRVYPQGHNSQSLSGVYLATNLYSVLLHAQNAVVNFGGKPLIFIIRGDIADTKMDEDHLKLFMQDFLTDTLDVNDEEIPNQMKSVLRQLFRYYRAVFEQSPPKAELAAWFKHVLEHGDEQRSGVYHQLIDAVARKTNGAYLDFVPAEEQSVRFIGNIGFTGSPRIIGGLVIDRMAYNLQTASRLPAHMLFGEATEELLTASQIELSPS